jgi:hypothetical protein
MKREFLDDDTGKADMTFRKLLLAAILAWLMSPAPATAQNNWPTPGGSGANGFVEMCLNSSGQAVPVSSGTCSGSNITLGPQPAANSLSTVQTTNPDLQPAVQYITVVDTGTTSTAGQNSVNLVTGTPTTGSAASFTTNGTPSGCFTVTSQSSQWTGTLTPEISANLGGQYVPFQLHQLGWNGPLISAITNNGVFCGSFGAVDNLRLRATAAITNSAAVQFVSSYAPGRVSIEGQVGAPLPSSGFSGQVVIATTNTPVQLPSNLMANGIIIKSKSTNNSSCGTVGFSSGLTNVYTGSGNGFGLCPGEQDAEATTNSNAIWLNGYAGDVFSYKGN